MSSLLHRAAPRSPQQRPPRVHELGDPQRHELAELVDADPIVNAVISSRLSALATMSPRHFGGTVLGARDAGGALSGAAFSGGNLLPIGGGPAEWEVLAQRIADRPRACSSIVGRAEAVAGMWHVLAEVWDTPRAVRFDQPLLVLDAPVGGVAADPRVRAIVRSEIDAYLPAAAAMFTEELGISPHECAGMGDYRRRVAGLIRESRAFGLVDDRGRVLFKADIGALTAHTCQVQGVWVRPELRGRGLGTAALAGVLQYALRLAPTASLYVNDFNTAARRMYATLGMRQVASLATILF